ncbi:hypothetical protein H9660_05130 [Clostridium sp. Sa3CUN1]|uniref:Uncharacterized protein n=1 Tax=Clostridium gallinarum TaxID=2762246 RepID=A0ABR8Q268_9CLOT|nr:hypothetical protein [Clostridium gallinarum]MBD7914521.1 hypothetical protein [Clostridium gallinarum]
MDNKELEIAKEIEEIALRHNVSVERLIEEYKKAHSLATTQENEHCKNNVNDILPLEADLDNGEIYDIETGVTIRRLEDERI